MEVAEDVGASESWVRRQSQHLRERGTLAPRSRARLDDQRTYNDADEQAIRELIAAKPDATLAEVIAAISKPASQATASRTLARLGLPRKKKSTHAAEQGRADVKVARAAWFEALRASPLASLVFVDEFGATTQMQRSHGRAPRGERVVAKVPHGHWKVLSTIAAMTTRGILCSGTFDGATDADTFAAFAREALVPSMGPGRVVVMDNLSAHKDPRVRAAIEAAGCRLLYLPPYSPDYNPIEQAISKAKSALRSAACRDVDLLYGAIAQALSTIAEDNATAFMQHSGYAVR